MLALDPAFFALRVGDLKLLWQAGNASWYASDGAGAARRDPATCNALEPVTQLFDLAADPEERRDLASEPEYADARARIEARARELLRDEHFEPALPFGSEPTEAAAAAFLAAGSYVVPWGCTVQ